jgi:hypothetical protein
MIPREGGNRFSGDFKASYRPGDWQSSNLTDRHKTAVCRPAMPSIRVLTTRLRSVVRSRKTNSGSSLSARYFSVNNFIANTFFNDGSKGIDDQFIRSAMARLTWQMSPRNKLSGYFDEIDKYRGHDMQSLEDPEEAALQWFSPAYHTASLKWTSTVSSNMLIEAGFSRNLEYYTNSYQDGVGQARGTAPGSRAHHGWRTTSAAARPPRPPRIRRARSARTSRLGLVHHRPSQHQGRLPVHVGRLHAHGGRQRRLDAAVPQQLHGRSLFGAGQRCHPQHPSGLR